MPQKLFEKLSPFFDLKKLWIAYLVASEKEKQEIIQTLKLLEEKTLHPSFTKDTIVLTPPKQDVAAGELMLGDVFYGKRKCCIFGLHSKEMCSHVGIFGRSGSSKTSLVMLLLWNLHRHKIPFLVFDWKKDYRGLKTLIDIEIKSQFTFNPFVPPRQLLPHEYKDYVKGISDLLITSFFPNMSLLSLEGLKVLFLQTVDRVCKKHGVYRGSQNYPTFNAVLATLQPDKNLAYAYGALRSCLQSLCTGTMDKIVNVHRNVDLLSSQIVLEVNQCGSESDTRFLTNSILYWIYYHRLSQGQTKQLRHVLILEEAHHLQGQLLERIFRMVRAMGQSLVFVDQHPSLISIPMFGNMYTTICLNLKAQDVDFMNNVFKFEGEQEEFINFLSPGKAIVKLQGRYPKPFLIHYPFFRLPQQQEKQPSTIELPKIELEFLLHVHRYPGMGVVKRYKKLKLSHSKGHNLKRRLVSSGLLRQRDISNSKGRVTFLELTTPGKNLLQQHKLYSENTKRHGGSEHQYAVCEIAHRFQQQGYSVETEYSIGKGKSVDVMLFRSEKQIPVEVETGASDWQSNIKKCMAEHDQMIVIALSSKLQQKIRTWVDEQGYKNVKVECL